MKELRKKVAIITGGSRGIGRACCLVFAREGAKIVFTYNKSKQAAAKLKKDLERAGADYLGIRADVRDYKQCQLVVEKTLKKFGQIDILINNAGITKDKTLMMMQLDEWHDVIETNLGGTFNMTRASIVTFLKQRSGCIINMSSVSGLKGIAGQTNYSASKAGIIGFSVSLAKEVSPYNVRVNVVCPGYINTDMLHALREEVKNGIINSIPARRLGEPEEVAYLCVYLSSEKAKYITGEVIKIDGGLTC